ncbi:MAG: hypothetical protein ACREAK_08180 [Nitrosarchaeum sp.]
MKQKIDEKSPEMKGDKIFLSGGHQVVLIVKGNDSWEEYYKKQCKKDDSWEKDGKILEQFEKDNNIEFLYCKSSEEISFWVVNPSILYRIKMFFKRGLTK